MHRPNSREMWQWLMIGVLFAGFLCVGLAGGSAASGSGRSRWREISTERLLRYIGILASDEFEGRAPASHGEELTTAFLKAEFEKLGLKPGNPDGTFFQKVPMVGITPDPAMRLRLASSGSKNPLELKYTDDFVAWTRREEAEVRVEADLVFVGYGIVAPEYQWDDYKGEDMHGKVLVMLVGDPPVPALDDPTRLDENVFKGKALTYYGRWTYKYEVAALKGAAGCLIIHETGPAGYPWEVVKNSFVGEQFRLPDAKKGEKRTVVEGWITWEKARALFARSGLDLSSLRRTAAERRFRPVPLASRAALTIRNQIRRIESANVIAKLVGNDPARRDEYVIYTAHWDHLGVGLDVQGDQIYHGARDNASGVAGLLEIARAFTKLQPPPRRSILFLALTGEEQGLLGSQYYAEHPPYPLAKTLAVLNMDGMNVLGRTKDVVVVGLGMSTLDDLVESAAAEQGRSVKPDAEPEKGFYYRSDHFNFAKHGVPALDTDEGIEFLGRPEGWGLEMRRRWTAEDYHKPSDRPKDYWDLSGLVEDLELLAEVGYRVANGGRYPAWKPGAEFKAVREAMLKQEGKKN